MHLEVFRGSYSCLTFQVRHLVYANPALYLVMLALVFWALIGSSSGAPIFWAKKAGPTDSSRAAKRFQALCSALHSSMLAQLRPSEVWLFMSIVSFKGMLLWGKGICHSHSNTMFWQENYTSVLSCSVPTLLKLVPFGLISDCSSFVLCLPESIALLF